MSCYDFGRSALAEDCLLKFKTLEKYFNEDDKFYFNAIKKILELRVPKKINVILRRKKSKFGVSFVAGYCPSCRQCVKMKFTFLRNHHGQYCDWCGQSFITAKKVYFEDLQNED